MRVQTEEWQRFIPGVRMYKGKLTYFYNGELLCDEAGEFLLYDEEERQKWEVIMVLPGVEIIHQLAFYGCKNVETVILMNDSVKRIEHYALMKCKSLKSVRLSKTLEYIGDSAFSRCQSLPSIFIPESCTEIGNGAFRGCHKLIILSVPAHTTLGFRVIDGKASPFEKDEDGKYERSSFSIKNRAINNEVNKWIKNINQAEEFALHRECASIEPPSEDNIYEIIKQEGLPSIHVKNEIGLTPLDYLQENPYTAENQIDQHKLMKRLVLDLMGEIIC